MPFVRDLVRDLARDIVRDATTQRFGAGVAYTLLAANNASNPNPLAALTGTTLTQVATSPVTVPLFTDSSGSAAPLQTVPAGYPVVPYARISYDEANGSDGTIPVYLPTDSLGNALATPTVLSSGLTKYTGGNAANPALAVLAEPAATNLLLYGNDFTNAAWTGAFGGSGTICSRSLVSTTLPDGTTGNASRLVFDCGVGTASTDFSSIAQATGGTGTRVAAVYLKSNTGTDQKVLLRAKDSQVVTETTVTTAWQRFSVLQETDGTRLQMLLQGSVSTVNTADILAYYATLEAGTVPSSTILTTTATVTRAARYTTAVGSEFGSNVRGQLVLNELGREQWILGNTHASGGGLYVSAANKLVWRGQSLGADLVDTMNTAAAWTAYGANTVADDSGQVKITYVDNANGAYVSLSAASGLNTNLVVGKTYLISGLARVNAGSSVQITFDGGLVSAAAITSTTNVPWSMLVTAINATTDNIRTWTMGTGEILWLSGIVVKEVKEISSDALTAGTIYDWGVSNDTTGATLSLAGAPVATDSSMTTPMTWDTVRVGADGAATAGRILNGYVSVLHSSNSAIAGGTN